MNSRSITPVDGSTRLFTVPFPFLSTQHVQFIVNRTIQLNPLDYEWVGPAAVEFRTAPSGVLEIRRKTPIDAALVKFQNGSALTEDELNLAVLQNLYISQETRDYYDALIDGSLDKLVTQVGGGAGAVIDKVIEEVLSSELLADLQARIGDIDLNANTINAQRIRLDTVEEVVDALADINGESIATFLLNEQAARISGDTALASTISLIGAKSGDGLSFILDTSKVRVSPTESLGTRLSGIQSSLGANQAAIATEQTARANGDSALASQITTLTTTVGNNTAAILAEQTARANADSALTTQINAVAASTGANQAAIVSETTARTNADSAMASQITTLQTSLAGNTASIQTLQTVTDGLKAQYMVKTDVNGYVAGFGLYNTGASSEFIILADKFALVTPGQSPQVPFAVDASGVYMNTAYIRNLVVDKIAGGNINSQWNINSVNGRIVLDTGTHMKVIGVGFGANSDLVEWYGPKMSVSLCTKANGTTWTDKSGNAYWGGSLSAGTLHSAGRWNLNSTNWNSPTYAVVQHVGSLGRPKTVVVSAVVDFGQRDAGNTQLSHNNSPKTGTVTVGVFRGAVELARWSRTVTSSAEYFPTEPGNPDSNYTQVWQTFGFGSNTLTDPYAGTGTVTYTVKVISSSGNFYPQNGGSFAISITEV